MFARHGIGREPDFHQFTDGPEVVNMPMRSSGDAAVVLKASGQTTRTKRTADINIKTFSPVQNPQPANTKRAWHTAFQHERVRAGLLRPTGARLTMP